MRSKKTKTRVYKEKNQKLALHSWYIKHQNIAGNIHDTDIVTNSLYKSEVLHRTVTLKIIYMKSRNK